MKYTMDSFLSALQSRLDELESSANITGASDIVMGFSDAELEQFDSIKEEAFSLYDDNEDALDFMYNRLLDKGYTDDEITQIFDYEGV